MWRYGDSLRSGASGQPSAVPAQSTYDLLIGMRHVAITLLFLDLSAPDRPVAQIPGFVEDVTTTALVLGLAAPLPKLNSRARFGVEVMCGPGILRFQTTCVRVPETGSSRIELHLPRQVESVQRRKFSRAPLQTTVAFSLVPEDSTGTAGQGGIGQSLDVSAGGLRLTTQMTLAYGQRLYVSFNTPDGSIYRGIPAKVVRVQRDDYRHTVAVQFTELTAEQENQLVQSVFRLQLRNQVRR